MNFLCRPDAAALLAADDYARLWGFFTGMGGQAWLDEATRERYRGVWRHGLEGALNYYRASPLRPPAGPADAIHAIEFADDAVTVCVPTTVLWGEGDTALPPVLLDGLERWVPDLDLRRVPGATHWLVHEDPARVAATIDELVARA
jgi:pimeloyl-ACP methyl ester carboxylesterase